MSQLIFENASTVAQQLSAIIVKRIEREFARFQKEFQNDAHGLPTRFCAIDDVFPDDIAREIYEKFPAVEKMRFVDSFRERKYTFKKLDECSPLLKAAEYAFQSPEVIRLCERLTGITPMISDPSFYAGGLSAMAEGHFLTPHIDNSHDSTRRGYRRLNLLYYVTPDWKPEYGGNLELWDTKVRKPTVIPSLFNRLVLMETNRRSWHSVCEVRHPGVRCCVSNYFFSKQSPEDCEYFHVTSFMARPEHRMQRLISRFDNAFRTGVRYVFKRGLGKVDVYQPVSK